jgi:integrase
MYLSNKNKFKIYYLFYKDKSTNKIKKVSTKTKLKKVAFEFVSAFNPEIEEDTKEKRKFSFNDLKDEALKYTSQNYTASTNQIYKYTIANFLKILGNKNLNTISINDIEFYKSERLKSIKKVTLNFEIRTLKALFNFAVRRGMAKENPCQFIKQYTLNETEKLSFEESDINTILETIDDETIRNIVLFALYTGCRISEILNIQWNDIDFIERIITIRNKPSFQTKTGKIRQIPISDKLLPILSEIHKGKNNSLKNILNFHKKEEYIFTNCKGLKYEYTTVTVRFKKYLRLAGIPEKYHFHCLRHTFITNLIKKGVSINFVKEIAGHSDIATTMNYIHIVTEDLRTAINQI